MKIDFKKYEVKYPKDPKPNSKHYKRMLKRIRKDVSRING